MPAERLEMRRVREILRYRFEQGLDRKSIAMYVTRIECLVVWEERTPRGVPPIRSMPKITDPL
ncbi:hypothetical protein CO676_27810 [Sinorhizobium sp. BJ1]|nr:hypothetical protein CO676_27810 [Sinorhizobium sp. BJ1]